jgi:outer membrane protein TolC
VADRDLKRAQLDQVKIAERDLARRVPLSAAAALRDLTLARSALASAAEAVKQFGQAVADQRDKLHEGVGTVIDLVLTEELLIGAEEARTANQLRCASALARVLYEMGALPAGDGGVAALTRSLGLAERQGP